MKRFLVLTFIMIFFVFPSSICAQSSLIDSFDSIDLSPEEKAIAWSNLDFRAIDPQNTKTELLHKSILSFDVAEPGIVFALEDSKIMIMDAEGTAQACFSFHCTGDYGVHWNEKNILLFQARGSLVYEITAAGELVEIAHLNERTWKTSALQNELTKRRIIVLGENTYELRNATVLGDLLGSQSYRMLVRTDADEKQTVLYDSGTNQAAVYFGLELVFIAIALCITAAYLRNKYKIRITELIRRIRQNPT